MTDTRSLSTIPSTIANAQAGQATMIEQQRAIAEVQGAIVVAQQCPRNETAAREAMLESCRNEFLSERAFFRFPKGRKKNEATGEWEENFVIGPSIHLARDLARIWGNVQYGIKELRRDDHAGESEMLAYAWDVQTNTRTETVFIVKHLRDKTIWVDRVKERTQEKLTDLRDIYENNANAGARRVRECIFAILPPWFTEQAKQECTKTNTEGGGKPLPERISVLLDRFAELGVRQEQLERKLGVKVGKWTGREVAFLIPVGRSLAQGETTVDAEFPPERVLSDDLAHSVPGPAPEVHAAPKATTPEPAPAPEDEDDPNSAEDPDSQPVTDTPAHVDWPDVVQPGTAQKDTHREQ